MTVTPSVCQVEVLISPLPLNVAVISLPAGKGQLEP